MSAASSGVDWFAWLLIVLTSAAIITNWLIVPRRERAMNQLIQESARVDLDLQIALRRTLEDLRRISPEIEEAVSLSIAEIDARRPVLEALVDGRRWVALRATYAHRRKP